jgi:cytosine/adenosine deaminase-related metal-dependent hydrolase
MALVVCGQIVSLAKGSKLGEPIKGRVWIGDDGLIAAVTSDNEREPDGFRGATQVDAPDDAYVMPGLIDLHNHIGYNVLPLWDTQRSQAFVDHEDWKAPPYKAQVTATAKLWAGAEPEALLAYVQTRALVGGTTAIQGWPASNPQMPAHTKLLRKIDDETGSMNEDRIDQIIPPYWDHLEEIAGRVRGRGVGFVCHCAEGQPGTQVASEFTKIKENECLTSTFMGVHCTALSDADWDVWSSKGVGALVWSPFSNLWLYGRTTPAYDAMGKGIKLCLGSDWGPSGTKHVLAELKVVQLTAELTGEEFSDQQLVEMVTTTPGDMLDGCWKRPIGRLTPGGFGDVLVLRGTGKGFWSDVVDAREDQVALVVVNGEARYGEPELMEQARAKCTTSLPLTRDIERLVAIPRPDDSETSWSWDDIRTRLEDVANKPDEAQQQADERLGRALAGPINGDEERVPLVLMLDMPDSGLFEVAGPVSEVQPEFPKNSEDGKSFALPSLVHDKAFFDAVRNQKIQPGVLNGLAERYGYGGAK